MTGSPSIGPMEFMMTWPASTRGTLRDNTWELTRVNSTNVLDEGLRIREVGHRMNSKVNQSNKVCIESKRGDELGLLSICLSPSSPGPYI
jgi:hypothetical protein